MFHVSFLQLSVDIFWFQTIEISTGKTEYLIFYPINGSFNEKK